VERARGPGGAGGADSSLLPPAALPPGASLAQPPGATPTRPLRDRHVQPRRRGRPGGAGGADAGELPLAALPPGAGPGACDAPGFYLTIMVIQLC
jgi:hypothetical protein